MLFNFRSQN